MDFQTLVAQIQGQKAQRQRPERLLNEAIDTEATRGRQYDDLAGQSRSRYLDALGGDQDALNRSVEAAVAAGMPGLQRELQGTREMALRRGVGTGDLGTSYEGDVFSAFQRNIANATAGQAMNLYGTQLAGYGDVMGMDTELAEGSRNRYLDILSGSADREVARQNARNARRKGLLGLGIGPL